MTTGPIGKANSDYSIKLPKLLKTQAGDNAQAAGGVKKVTTVDMQPNKQIDRTDLDKLSPYSAMGLQLTQKPAVGTVESYAQAAPEFSGWQGNYTINNKQEAISYLNAYQTALQTYKQVAPHLQNSPFADLYTA